MSEKLNNSVKKKPKRSRNVKKADIAKSMQNKHEIIGYISEETGVKKFHVRKVLVTLRELLCMHMNKKGSGKFSIPMVGIKLYRVKKKARKERKIFSPLVGKEVIVKPRPQKMVIKAKFFKTLREAANK